MSEDKKAKRYQEKFKLKQLEMKEKNKEILYRVSLISTIITVGLAIGTLVVLKKEP